MATVDWQTSQNSLTARGEYLLNSGKWADCHFLLGQQLISGHKLILAMASPVFEAMFYGELAEKNDPIPILDVQPDAFRSLLEYIYTDVIKVDTVDKACGLCYVAKKYMLPHVVETCTNFIFKDLRPTNACRAYEFAKLFEEPRLMKNCLTIMCNRTLEVIEDPSFEEADVNTILTIVEQEVLNINSELSLFHAINRYAEKQQLTIDPPPLAMESNNPSAEDNLDVEAGRSRCNSIGGENKEQQQRLLRSALQKIRFLTLTPQEFAEGPGKSKLLNQTEAFHILMNISSSTASVPMPDGFTTTRDHRSIGSFEFRATQPLNVTPHDRMHLFEIPSAASSSSSSASFIVPPCAVAEAIPMQAPPPPPTLDRSHSSPNVSNDLVQGNNSPGGEEAAVSRRYYCVRFIRTQTDCLNTSILDCSLTFSVDRSICVTGCQVPTQVLGGINIAEHRPTQDGNFPDRYSELLYAHLLDSLGSRLTYTHCTSRVRFDSMLEISFDRPVYIQKNKIYKIGVVFNKVGWYPMAQCVPHINVSNVGFTFCIGSNNDSVRDGLIRAIVFTFPNEIEARRGY